MDDEVFYNSDGDFLIVPYDGTLYITTEYGKMSVKPREICVIPRITKFKVDCSGVIRGYVCEVYNGHFTLPNLGPIGANVFFLTNFYIFFKGLANARDFEIPVAYFENNEKKHKILNKFCGKFFDSATECSPFDTVAW